MPERSFFWSGSGPLLSLLIRLLSAGFGVLFIAYGLAFIPTQSWLTGALVFIMGEFFCIYSKLASPFRRGSREGGNPRKECHPSQDNVTRNTAAATEEGSSLSNKGIKTAVDPRMKISKKEASILNLFYWTCSLISTVLAFSLGYDINETRGTRYLFTHMIEVVLAVAFLRSSFFFMQKTLANISRNTFDEMSGDRKNCETVSSTDSDVASSSVQTETDASGEVTTTTSTASTKLQPTPSSTSGPQATHSTSKHEAPSTAGRQETSSAPVLRETSSTPELQAAPSEDGRTVEIQWQKPITFRDIHPVPSPFKIREVLSPYGNPRFLQGLDFAYSLYGRNAGRVIPSPYGRPRFPQGLDLDYSLYGRNALRVVPTPEIFG